MAVYLPKGTRDFLPAQMNRRQHVIDTVRRVFVLHGFEPLETPAFERIETLTGKYGEEGDRLIYKILKRGKGARLGECDLALRYDLTVPFARVLAMHPELRMPFKRYQMQPVWRADRPQKGRFREFWQCDVDIAGTRSPVADAECLAVVSGCLTELGFDDFTILLNDRRILSSLARRVGESAREGELLVALDKLDKIGRDGVSAEMRRRGIAPESVAALWEVLEVPDDEGALDALEGRLDDEGRSGIAALRQVVEAALAFGLSERRLRIAPTLARGLDYYTGPVFETVVDEPRIGTIAAGGRYDGLIELLSGRDVPAVGVALGLERIIAVMDELDRLPQRGTAVEALVTVYGPELLHAAIDTGRSLREAGISTEVYLGDSRLKSQFKYANARGFPWLLVVGPREADQGAVSLKNLQTGEQRQVRVAEAAAEIVRHRTG